VPFSPVYNGMEERTRFMSRGMPGEVIGGIPPGSGPQAVAVMTDEQLLERFVARQEGAAFEELVRRHGPMVWRVCRRMLANAQDAEDAFQATFIVLIRRGPAIAKRESVGSWLHGVAAHIALQTREAANRQRTATQQMQRQATPVTADASSGAAGREVHAVLDEELNRLPEKYRAPLVLCYLEGKTTEETAQQLGCPKGTILWRLAEGRERLRSRLTRRGVAISAVALSTLLAQGAAHAALPASLTAAATHAASVGVAGKALGAGVLATKAGALANATMKAAFWAKVKLATIALATAAVAVGVPAYLALKPDNSGLVLHYALQEGTGTKVRDTSPTGNDGTLAGGVTWVAGPRPGTKALLLDGQSGRVELAKDVSPWLGKTATVACWIKTTQNGGGSDSSSPALIGTAVPEDNDVVWGWLDNTGRIGVAAGAGPAAHGTQASAQSQQPINDGRWHHVAMTRQADTGAVTMYVDGVFQSMALSGVGPKAAPLTALARFDSFQQQAVYYFSGALGDLRIYARALSADEIRRLAQ
jgi:RNA polymerase sigma factor (sigma-70 family)